jgi:adenylate kinase
VYIIFLGAPGVGKGTQAVNVARELNLMHIASGDLFRQAIERGDKLGAKVKAYTDKGMLVPDEITIGMILDKISALERNGGVILDGFPRNLKQARAIDESLRRQNKAIDWVIYIKVSEEELIRRLSGRLICRNCQASYHIINSPPKVRDRCDLCGGELYQRADDNIETVKKRLKVYFNETMPVVEYYQQQGKLLEVNGEGNVNSVTRRIINTLHKREFIAG